jgi:formate dehydrogenase subunit delta
MPDSELEHLVQMANQIAANFRFNADTEDRIVDHLTRFWAPSMRRQLVHHAQQGAEGLEPEVIAAVRRLDAE